MKYDEQELTPRSALSAQECQQQAQALIEREAEQRSGKLDLSWFSNLASLPPALQELSHLQVLDCAGTAIHDLRPLAGLSRLRRLELSCTPLIDVSPLQELHALRCLYLIETGVADLTPLASLHALRELYLFRAYAIEDLSPLVNLPDLQVLDCCATGISSLEPVSRLCSLQKLNFFWTRVADLSPLAQLHALHDLVCSNDVSDIAPLAHLQALQSLSFGCKQVCDLQHLAQLPHLSALCFSSAQVCDVRPLAQLAALKELRCENTEISALPSAMPALHTLHINCCRVHSFSPDLFFSPKLQAVYAEDCILPGVPEHIFSKFSNEDCLPELRSYLLQREQSIAPCRRIG